MRSVHELMRRDQVLILEFCNSLQSPLPALQELLWELVVRLPAAKSQETNACNHSLNPFMRGHVHVEVSPP
jgi:hypothetical protein